jgi:predicted metal-dependent phosphoesterase TrpH
MLSGADLHMHSLYSLDGEFSIKDLLAKCREHNLNTISLTDHNSVKGLGEAIDLAFASGINVIPGIEIDCIYSGIDLHILGYNIRWDSKEFSSLEEDVNRRIMESFPEMLRLLKKSGITVNADEVMALSQGRPPVAEQIAEVLVTNPVYHSNVLLKPYLPGGSRSDMPYINFYHDYFSQGRPAYVKIDYMSYETAIDLIKSQDGIPIVAHPGVNLRNHESVINELLDQGALGLEAFNNYHDYDQISYFAGIADQRNLLLTCGSDFHGKTKPLIKPGLFKQISRYEEKVDKSVQVLLKRVNC